MKYGLLVFLESRGEAGASRDEIEKALTEWTGDGFEGPNNQKFLWDTLRSFEVNRGIIEIFAVDSTIKWRITEEGRAALAFERKNGAQRGD